MQKKTLSAIVAVLAVAVIAVAGFYFKKQKGGGETISTAYDLTSKAGALPDGWYVNSYEDQYQVYGDESGVVTLHSDIADDLRLCKKVTVQEGSLYVLTGYIATEGVANGRGASLSIDNYSLDKSCVYTQGLQGDNDFTETKLYFETKPGQTEIILALRLGGYSEASSGTVRFKDVSLRSGTADEGRYQLLEAWGGSSNDDDDDAFRDEEHYKSFFAVIVWAAVLSGVLLIFGIYRNRKLLTGRTLPEKGYWGGFAFIVVVGLLLRLILCALYRGHDSDMGCFIGWGQDIARNGTQQFYWAAGHDWYDYPPGYMLFLGGYSAVLNLFRVDTGTVLGIFLYMLPAIAADLFLSLLLMSFARKQRINNAGALILGGLVFLNPALLFLTGAWGQIDSILTLWLVVSFLLLLDPKPGTVDRNRVLSGAVFGLAVMTKWQAPVPGPLGGEGGGEGPQGYGALGPRRFRRHPAHLPALQGRSGPLLVRGPVHDRFRTLRLRHRGGLQLLRLLWRQLEAGRGVYPPQCPDLQAVRHRGHSPRHPLRVPDHPAPASGPEALGQHSVGGQGLPVPGGVPDHGSHLHLRPLHARTVRGAHPGDAALCLRLL